jgi:serine-type D-Ala-D-Ala carboxypeptidase/endopeptidase (penicillin-binding protein 4)
MGRKRATARCVILALFAFYCAATALAPSISAQTPPGAKKLCCASNTPAKSAHVSSSSGSAAQTAHFGARVDALLGLAPVNKGAWGLLILDAESGDTLYEQNADRYFVPASNMKLFTTALALEKLGLDYRFHTTLESQGSLSSEGTLSGDLSLVGRGDPNLSNRKFPYELKEEFDGPSEKTLIELADKLVLKGVKEISGDIVGDDSYFPRERYPSGWEVDDMVWEYGAAISAIAVDDNTVALTLSPGTADGAPVLAETSPITPDFSVENEVVTSAPEIKSDLRLTREPGSNLVIIRGTLPAKSSPRKLVLAIEEPALHAATLLKHLLEERGIKVDGVARAHHQSASSEQAGTLLVEHISVPLGDSVKLVNKISQNLHAELLLRTAARQSGIWSTPEDLLKFPADFYDAAGIAPGDVIQTDGSGLSRHDLITPRATAALLKYAQGRPWFGTFFDSLPLAGVDGTLEDRMKNSPVTGRIHAKTGSVEHVRTLSGYALTPGGRRLIFSFLSNNQGGKSHEAADALGALCLAMLEEFNSVPPKRGQSPKHPQ